MERSTRTTYRKILLTIVVVTGASAYFVSRQDLDAGALLAATRRLPLWSLGIAIALGLAQNACQSSRLWALLPPELRTSWLDVFRNFSAGQLVNSFIPGRVGDAVKVGLIQRRAAAGGISQGTGELVSKTATIAGGVFITDKLVDLTSLAVLMGLLAPVALREVKFPRLEGGLLAAVLLLIVVVVAVLIVAIARSPRRSAVSRFLRDLLATMRPRRLMWGLVFGALAWLSESVILVSLASSMGFPISIAGSLCALTALNFGIAAPIAVANLVTFEVSLSVGLAGFGVPVTTALAVAAVHHLVQLASVALLAATFAVVRPRKPRPDFLVRSGDKQRAVDYYQRLSTNYDGTAARGLLKLLRDRERRSVLSLCGFGDPSKRTMIDVGCGGGFYALAAMRAGMHVSAMDIAPGMVQGMKCLVDEAWLGDIETHQGAQKTYDIVLCSGVLDFVLRPELAFRNLAGLVAPAGRLVVNAPRAGLTGWIYRLEKRLLRVEVNLFALDWFEREAEKHGLQLRRFTHPLPTNRALLFERPAAQ
jgi:2-polyprenyl-3-methyl-5-hydroxy-6-metoxy-1,4-benzoquinol methylase/uncharacterized membrane protein YbhN (UPF0104 family)